MHPVGRSLPAKVLHDEVEGEVDEEVDHDEGEDVAGRAGKPSSSTCGEEEPKVDDVGKVDGGCHEDERDPHLQWIRMEMVDNPHLTESFSSTHLTESAFSARLVALCKGSSDFTEEQSS